MEKRVIEIKSVVEGIFHKEVGPQILMHFHLIYSTPCHVRGKVKKIKVVFKERAAMASK